MAISFTRESSYMNISGCHFLDNAQNAFLLHRNYHSLGCLKFYKGQNFRSSWLSQSLTFLSQLPASLVLPSVFLAGFYSIIPETLYFHLTHCVLEDYHFQETLVSYLLFILPKDSGGMISAKVNRPCAAFVIPTCSQLCCSSPN